MSPAPPRIFAQSRRIASRQRAVARRAGGGATPFILEEMVEDVRERLAFTRHEAKRVLVIGDWPGLIAPHLQGPGIEVTSLQPGDFDEEAPLLGGPYDLIVNLQCIDTVNDLPGALIHARLGLAKGGLFVGCFLGAGSLAALRSCLLAADGDRPAARIHPQVDNQASSALMQRAGFNRQVVDSFSLKARYSSWQRIVQDLRDQGLTACLASHAPPLHRAGWQRAEAAFSSMADEDGRVTELFEILTLTGWRD